MNDKIKLKLADSIRSGLTVKDACEVAGISTSTFNRWRASDLGFNKLIDEATRRGWENAEIFAKYYYRGYKRQITHHCPLCHQTRLHGRLVGLQGKIIPECRTIRHSRTLACR